MTNLNLNRNRVWFHCACASASANGAVKNLSRQFAAYQFFLQQSYGYYPLRRTYLRKHKPKLWMVLVNTGRVDDHLTSIEREAERRMDTLLPQLIKNAGVTEELKARDQMYAGGF